MNKFLCLFVFLSCSLFSYSQERKIQISAHAGFFKAGNYPHIDLGNSYGMDVSYFLSKHFFLTAHFNYGENGYYYYDDSSFIYSGNMNSTEIMNNVGLLAGYYQPVTQWGNITGQIGFAQIIEVTRRPSNMRVYRPDSQVYERIEYEHAMFSASFPVKFSIGITPFKKLNINVVKNIEIAYTYGWYIEPDFGFFTGIYHGPQLSVSF